MDPGSLHNSCPHDIARIFDSNYFMFHFSLCELDSCVSLLLFEEDRPNRMRKGTVETCSTTLDRLMVYSYELK
jgi:hypothetical protein